MGFGLPKGRPITTSHRKGTISGIVHSATASRRVSEGQGYLSCKFIGRIGRIGITNRCHERGHKYPSSISFTKPRCIGFTNGRQEEYVNKDSGAFYRWHDVCLSYNINSCLIGCESSPDRPTHLVLVADGFLEWCLMKVNAHGREVSYLESKSRDKNYIFRSWRTMYRWIGAL